MAAWRIQLKDIMKCRRQDNKTKMGLDKKRQDMAKYMGDLLTDEVRHQTTVGKSSGGESEVGLAVGPEVSLVKSCGVDVIIVAGVQERVSKYEQSSMIFRQRMGFYFNKATPGNEGQKEDHKQQKWLAMASSLSRH